MKFATFIVVDDKLSRDKETCEYTVNGDVIYPLLTPLPVIKQGSGCIGIGIITSSIRKSSSTTVVFSLSKVSSEDANAYYNLYRNQISTLEDADDAYEATADMIIPGMMTRVISRPKGPSSGRPSPKRRQEPRRSLSDYMDDDDDDDFYNNPNWR